MNVTLEMTPVFTVIKKHLLNNSILPKISGHSPINEWKLGRFQSARFQILVLDMFSFCVLVRVHYTVELSITLIIYRVAQSLVGVLSDFVKCRNLSQFRISLFIKVEK